MSPQTLLQPGPASSVEDRSLRKFRPRGPRFDPRNGSFFSDAINSHVCLTEIPTFGRVLPINATSTRKAVAASLLGKKERSLNKLAL